MYFKLIKKLWPYIKEHKGKAIGTLLLSLVLTLLKAGQAYLVKPIFDKGLSDTSTFQEALILAGILMGLMIVNFPARFLHFYWIRYIVDKATCRIRLEMFDKIQKLPTAYFNKNKQGNLISGLINDTHIFSQGFRSYVDLIREPLMAIAFLGLALYRDWALTLVIFAVAPLFLIIFGKTGKLVKSHQGEVQEELAEMTHNMSEGLGGQKIAKAFNLQSYILNRFRKAQDLFFKAQMKTTSVEELAHPLVELVGGIAFSGIIIFAHKRIQSGAMTTGDFVSFVAAMALFMDPIRKLSQANIKMGQAGAAGKRIWGLLDLPEEKDDGESTLNSFEKEIQFKNVSFSYGNGHVIQNFSLTIKKGEKVALVGLSGSGKSTLINLLLGLYPLEEGEILIDGKAISSLSLHSLRNLYGLVSQDIFLFHDSIRENLNLGNNFNEEIIQKSLRVAHAKEFIDLLPQQIDTYIGDRGTRLSGGQQQRVTIARAFLKDPDIFLFDEATSALDNESEKIVQQALQELAGDKTVIAVAHRLTTIQDFDKIVVLNQGKSTEMGTHQELIQRKGEYSKLYELSNSSFSHTTPQ